MLVAVDFDGTLAAIVPDPDTAQPWPGAVAALSELASRADTRVALVSGRALGDLQTRCAVPGAWYIGGHGNEVAPPGGAAAHEAASALAGGWSSLEAFLAPMLTTWPGVWLEIKPYSAALHYRQAPQFAAATHAALAKWASAQRTQFRLLEGRQLVELLPARALNKGQAVARLIQQLACDLTFYFGDDVTDEDVFRLRHRHLIGIKIADDVCRGDSAAPYHLDAPAAVVTALQAIRHIRSDVQNKGVAIPAIPLSLRGE